jgi:hypothetical protein
MIKNSTVFLLVFIFTLFSKEIFGKVKTPPKNPFLANDILSTVHGNSFAQQSSPLKGPIFSAETKIDYLHLGSPGFPLLSRPYPDGKKVVWISTQSAIVKVDIEGDKSKIIDQIQKPHRLNISKTKLNFFNLLYRFLPPKFLGTLLQNFVPNMQEARHDGGYAVLDKDNKLYFADRRHFIVVYGDKNPLDSNSKIKQLHEFQIPHHLISLKDKESINGINLTYDGKIVFLTTHGLVGVINRELKNFKYLRLINEKASNSISVDNKGGIYVVTDKKMHRIQWTGTKLSQDEKDGAWSAHYHTGGQSTDIRLGNGSGSTPTLMGTDEKDSFVVITDGASPMNLVLFWRNQIPDHWEKLPGSPDRRMAGMVPVTFGKNDGKAYQSEQSVLVNGYKAFVVSNTLQMKISKYPPVNVALSGHPKVKPTGAELFEWNPKNSTLISKWSYPTVSFPNTIPTMSRASNLIYGVGRRNNHWTIETLDWKTGKLNSSFPIGKGIEYNSAYMATGLFPNETIIYGSSGGMVKINN